MSTNDVPGANPINDDELHMGCWAEHEDGSLILVKSTEGDRVIYEMYDTAGGEILFYQDAMAKKGFEKQFSWNPKNPKQSSGIKWTWHDKTPFPWDRVIKEGARPGVHPATAEAQLTAAARVAKSLSLKAQKRTPENLRHLMDQLGPRGRGLMERIQGAIDKLPKDEALAVIAEEVRSIDEKPEKPKRPGLIRRIFGGGK